MLHFALPSAIALSVVAAQATDIGALALSQAPQPIPTAPLLPDLTDPATEVMALEEDRNERFTVPVTIDGMGPYKFMIDTGSQATVVTDHVTRQVLLPPLGPAMLVGMASRRQVELVELDRFEVGTRTIHNIAAPVLLRQHIGADGIIGLDTLQDFRVLIDFRNETIAIADAEDHASDRGFEIVVRARNKLGQLLITDALVEGVRATVIIDTGAQASLGNLALQRKIRAKRSHDVETTDVNGVTMTNELSYARTLKFQGLEMTNVAITYADAPAFEALGLHDKPVLSIGMQHLRLFDRLAIDFAKRRILFDLPSSDRRQIADWQTSRL